MRDGEGLLHHLVCPGTELSVIFKSCCQISFKCVKQQYLVTFFDMFILQHCLVYCEGD